MRRKYYRPHHTGRGLLTGSRPYICKICQNKGKVNRYATYEELLAHRKRMH